MKDKSKTHFIYSFDDETSMFDPKGIWVGGSEYYKRTFRCWLPNRMKNSKPETVDKYIEKHEMDSNFWLE